MDKLFCKASLQHTLVVHYHSMGEDDENTFHCVKLTLVNMEAQGHCGGYKYLLQVSQHAERHSEVPEQERGKDIKTLESDRRGRRK